MCHINSLRLNGAAACDVTGGVASFNFDATELQVFKGDLGSPSKLNLQYGQFEPYKNSNVWSLCMQFYGRWQVLAMRHRTLYLSTKLWAFL